MDADHIQEEFIAACEFLNDKKVSEAEDIFRQIVEKSPYHLQSLVNLTLILSPVDSLEFYDKIFKYILSEDCKGKLPQNFVDGIQGKFDQTAQAVVDTIFELCSINKLDIATPISDKLLSLHEYVTDKNLWLLGLLNLKLEILL